MAKLFARIEDERGIQVHKIANREICADFYYGSRERSIKALRVCATVEPAIGATFETVKVTADFISPRGEIIHSHKEEYLMPAPTRLLREATI
jgi:hypothetical protein